MPNILPWNAAEKMKANKFFRIWEKGKLKFCCFRKYLGKNLLGINV